jgi:large subunit ribosomal protein L32
MAVPKKKHSKSRKNKRRSTWKLTAPQYISCPRCHQDRMPHHVCPHCGYYNGRIVIDHEA